MLGEDGMVLDDGVTIRLEENRYLMHTTTGGAALVLAWMERWLQTEWPELEVFMTSVTDHWATAAVVGPNSRKVVSALCEGIDFDAGVFPFMSSRQGTVRNIPARVNRISFSGELAYEVNVPANYGRQMWEALMAAGKRYDITSYGTETMHVLRAERGMPSWDRIPTVRLRPMIWVWTGYCQRPRISSVSALSRGRIVCARIVNSWLVC